MMSREIDTKFWYWCIFDFKNTSSNGCEKLVNEPQFLFLHQWNIWKKNEERISITLYDIKRFSISSHSIQKIFKTYNITTLHDCTTLKSSL